VSTDDVEDPATAEAPQKPRPRREPKARRKRRREPAPVPVNRERTIRGIVVVASFVALIGLALVGTRDSGIGQWLVIGGLLTLIGSIHMLGRLGPDGGLPSR
jgi:hypothetical protein